MLKHKRSNIIIFLITAAILLSATIHSSPTLVYNSSFRSTEIDVGQQIHIFLSDWDNDGKKDIVAGCADGNIVWFKNFGGNPASVYYQGIILNDTPYSSPVVVDWNNDGRKDLIASNTNGIIRKYINTGTDTNPAFSSATTIDSAGNGQPIRVPITGAPFSSHPWVVDYNNDGKKDLVVGYNTAGWYSACLLYFNNGTDASPSFDTGFEIPNVNWGYRGITPVFCDWNNDGKKDIVVALNESGQHIRIYINSNTDTSPSYSSYTTLTSGGYTATTGSDMFISVADWNEDGKKDIVISERYGHIYYIKNSGADDSPLFSNIPEPITSAQHNIVKTNCGVFPFDLESDSDIDLIVGLGVERAFYLIYKNTGSYSSPNYVCAGPARHSTGIIPSFNNWHSRAGVYDYNNDGLYDFISGGGDNASGFYFYRNAGTNQNPYFTYAYQLQKGGVNINVGKYSTPRIYDWNNDGKKDLISGCDTGNILLFLNTNTEDSPVYNECVFFCDSTGVIDLGNMSAPCIFDWNGDGKKDILAGNSSGDINLYININNDTLLYNAGKIKSDEGSLINFGSNATPVFIDYDYDGKEDLILSGGGMIYLFLNKEPVSSVNSLPAIHTSLSFTVTWTGTAYKGIKSYDVQYKDNDTGTWTDWLIDTTATSAGFTGQNGHKYYFICRAKDNTNNYEAYPLTHDAYTEINVDYDKTKVTNLNAATGSSDGEIVLTWTAPMDPVNNSTPVSSYKIKYSKTGIDVSGFDSLQDVPVTPPSPAGYGETQTLSVLGLNPGDLYYFALRPADSLGANLSASNVASAKAFTKYVVSVALKPNNENAVTISNPEDTCASLQIPAKAVGSEITMALYRRRTSELTYEQIVSAKNNPDIKDPNPLALYDVMVYDSNESEVENFALLKPARFDIQYSQPGILFDEQFISAFKWTGGNWLKLTSYRNPEKNVITFYPDKFSRFALFIEKSKNSGAVPEFCTPNSDDINDNIYFFFSASGVKQTDIYIYDLDGKIIRKIENAVSGATYWDGRNSAGQPVETGIYIFRIISGSVSTGTIYVVR